jgi:DHA1 family tetracycline resistance protein-like MFS transporter
MSVGLILPVMPQLIASVRGASVADAALWGGLLSAAFAVSQFLFTPMLGALSDRFGRRPVLLVSLAVMAVDFVVMALAQTIWVLLAGRIVSGVAAATYVTALAYVADITNEKDRARRFGLVSAALGLGLVLGPVVGGLVGTIDPRAPFVFAAILATANLVVGIAALPETLVAANRRPFELGRANPIASLATIGKLPALAPLLTAFVLIQLAANVYPAVWAFYTEAALGWTAAMIGGSLAVYGVSAALAQAVVAPALLSRIGELRSIRLGMTIGIVCLMAYGIATSETIIWLLVPFAAVATLATPVLQGLLSRNVPADRQGELQGVLGSLSAVALIVSPIVMTQAFAWGTRSDAAIWLPGAPFIIAALLLAAALAVLALWPVPRTTAEARPA